MFKNTRHSKLLMHYKTESVWICTKAELMTNSSHLSLQFTVELEPNFTEIRVYKELVKDFR